MRLVRCVGHFALMPFQPGLSSFAGVLIKLAKNVCKIDLFGAGAGVCVSVRLCMHGFEENGFKENRKFVTPFDAHM